jgi:hypothetical protein
VKHPISPAHRNRRSRDPTGLAAVAGLAILLGLSFPSFVDARELLPSGDEMSAESDIRKLAPPKPNGEEKRRFAIPSTGTNLKSVEQNWASQQAHIITGGADERMLQDINHGLTRWIASSEDDVRSEDDPRPKPPMTLHPDKPVSGLRPSSLRFATINRLEIGWRSRAKFSCIYQGDSIQWNMSRPINEKFDVNLRHETRDSTSSIQFNYNW